MSKRFEVVEYSIQMLNYGQITGSDPDEYIGFPYCGSHQAIPVYGVADTRNGHVQMCTVGAVVPSEAVAELIAELFNENPDRVDSVEGLLNTPNLKLVKNDD